MKTELRYGKRIKEERLAHGWTQEHLAEVAGLAARTVARIEGDEVQGLESLMAIAAALDTEPKKLALTLRTGEVKPTRSLLVKQPEDRSADHSESGAPHVPVPDAAPSHA